ncbi:NAD(P)H dehydrogenase (quinone) protein [Dioscorea alata]|uniref:NAD(P)H dehydrogenase (Quinone) protein n=1 Tax=Dioscorea alata TaxID=55571 RepID=A0ACB7V1P3_DIOAL|nr:NAD(P)H dehydrogenase (quinone) protein [Dioscorea alata]
MTLMLTVESGCTEKCIYAFPRIMGQCFSSRTQATPIVAAAESPPLVKLGLEEMAMATGNPIIKVAAVCGSLRKGSFNRGLIRAAVQLCNESVKGMEIDYVDIGDLPFLNTDLEVNGTYPASVEAFRSRILQADSILFASPEYNYSVTECHRLGIKTAKRLAR